MTKFIVYYGITGVDKMEVLITARALCYLQKIKASSIVIDLIPGETSTG